MNSRADERRRCVRRSRVVLASVADVKPAEVLRAEPGFAEPPICRRRWQKGIRRREEHEGNR